MIKHDVKHVKNMFKLVGRGGSSSLHELKQKLQDLRAQSQVGFIFKSSK